VKGFDQWSLTRKRVDKTYPRSVRQTVRPRLCQREPVVRLTLRYAASLSLCFKWSGRAGVVLALWMQDLRFVWWALIEGNLYKLIRAPGFQFFTHSNAAICSTGPRWPAYGQTPFWVIDEHDIKMPILALLRDWPMLLALLKCGSLAVL
jgi:hypothetical protein